jgi:hypothetical protein
MSSPGGAHWTQSTVNGTGVTIFFTKGNGAQYGQFLVDAPIGYSYINLSAPTTSSNLSVPTILFFGDRNWVHTSAQDFQWSRALFVGDGIWYFTGTGVSVINCGSLYGPHYLALVVDNLYAQDTDFGLFTNFSVVPTGNPFRTQGVLVQ